MNPVYLCFTAFIVCACGSDGQSAYRVTPIPFNIDNLTDDQRRVITEGNEADTSLNYIKTRPVLFQIVGTPNEADESRGPGRISMQVDVLIYGLGEAAHDRLVDFGWLENVETGKKVWEMTLSNTEHAGGDPRNRKRVSQIELPPGVYRLRYQTNDSHAFPGWEGDPPEHAHLYGITMFNLTALPGIEKRLKKAGVPPLRTSLERPYNKPPPQAR